MTTTNFQTGTLIESSWLNDVDQAVYQASSGIIGAVDRTLTDKLSEFVSVKDFGAVGDGVTDDTSAIQAALDAAINVTFPSGTYLVSSNITVPIHSVMVAEKARQVIITSATNILMMVKDGTSNSSPDNASDVEIRGILFDGVSVCLTDYIYWFRLIDCSFTCGLVTANTYNAVYTDTGSAETTRIENAEIIGNRFVSGRRATYINCAYDEINIRRNYVSTMAQSGIFVSSTDLNTVGDMRIVNITDNTITDVGTNATEAYVNAILVAAETATVTNNHVHNVKNTNYWEVDGIYVKAVSGIISNNTIYNGGYRSNIQTKQLGTDAVLGNGNIEASSIVVANNEIRIDETSGYAGSHGGIFSAFAGRVFCGINIVTSNTVVCDNVITGAGVGISGVNSFTNWLCDNVVIKNNHIVENRGAVGIWWAHAGTNVMVSNNTITAPTNALSFGTFTGIRCDLTATNFLSGSATDWPNNETQYTDKKVTNYHILGNTILQTLSTSSTITGIYLAASDASAGGGDVTVNPGSFENAVIRENIIQAGNGGAGSGYGVYAVAELDRFSGLIIDANDNIFIEAKTAKINPPTGYIPTTLFGVYHLWVEASTGKLRINGSRPATDSAGTVVGTQS